MWGFLSFYPRIVLRFSQVLVFSGGVDSGVLPSVTGSSISQASLFTYLFGLLCANLAPVLSSCPGPTPSSRGIFVCMAAGDKLAIVSSSPHPQPRSAVAAEGLPPPLRALGTLCVKPVKVSTVLACSCPQNPT